MPDPELELARRAVPKLWPFRFVVWIGYWIGLFVIMHRPINAEGKLPLLWADKIVHFFLYFLLAMLGAWCFRGNRGRLPIPFLAGWAAVYAAYGAIDEWLQRFVQRTPSVGDWLADVGGIVVATAVVAAWQNRRDSSGTPQV